VAEEDEPEEEGAQADDRELPVPVEAAWARSAT
jgi:hypothetical protein